MSTRNLAIEMDENGDIWLVDGETPLAQICPEMLSGLETFELMGGLIRDSNRMEFEDQQFRSKLATKCRSIGRSDIGVVLDVKSHEVEWIRNGAATWRQAIDEAMAEPRKVLKETKC